MTRTNLLSGASPPLPISAIGGDPLCSPGLHHAAAKRAACSSSEPLASSAPVGMPRPIPPPQKKIDTSAESKCGRARSIDVSAGSTAAVPGAPRRRPPSMPPAFQWRACYGGGAAKERGREVGGALGFPPRVARAWTTRRVLSCNDGDKLLTSAPTRDVHITQPSITHLFQRK